VHWFGGDLPSNILERRFAKLKLRPAPVPPTAEALSSRIGVASHGSELPCARTSDPAAGCRCRGYALSAHV